MPDTNISILDQVVPLLTRVGGDWSELLEALRVLAGQPVPPQAIWDACCTVLVRAEVRLLVPAMAWDGASEVAGVLQERTPVAALWALQEGRRCRVVDHDSLVAALGALCRHLGFRQNTDSIVTGIGRPKRLRQQVSFGDPLKKPVDVARELEQRYQRLSGVDTNGVNHE